MTTVLKLGGELLEDAAADARGGGRRSCASPPPGRWSSCTAAAARSTPSCARAARRRASSTACAITDEAALDTVVAVLAGRTNTALVAAIGAAGGRAVGLTGADGADRAGATRGAASTTVSGERVDLGLVGRAGRRRDASLLTDLLGLGYVPVIASIGVDADGALLNVNADTLAAHWRRARRRPA